MPWTKLCAVADIGARDAAAFSFAGEEILLLRSGGRYLVLATVCPHVPRFLAHGDVSECVEAGVPKCNRHRGVGGAPITLGICDEPILAYACRETDGALYVDLERREVSPYQRITCSPVLESGKLAALQFNLWLDGEHKQTIYGAPDPTAPK
jgi:nitrite reductase/ring-hydroxylating ferredoxin subunit